MVTEMADVQPLTAQELDELIERWRGYLPPAHPTMRLVATVDAMRRSEAGGIDVAGLIDLQERLAANMAQPSLAGYEALARDAIIALRAALRATPSPSPNEEVPNGR